MLKGWTTEPVGGGDAITANSVLLGSSPDGIPADVTAHAWWATTPELSTGVDDDAATITAGEPFTFTPTVVDEFGDAYPTDPVGWTLTDADGQISVVVDTATGEITLVSTAAGVYELDLAVPTPPGTSPPRSPSPWSRPPPPSLTWRPRRTPSTKEGR